MKLGEESPFHLHSVRVATQLLYMYVTLYSRNDAHITAVPSELMLKYTQPQVLPVSTVVDLIGVSLSVHHRGASLSQQCKIMFCHGT